jgi:alkylation response protein AidB-like acyl-CoA dehydrogenase
MNIDVQRDILRTVRDFVDDEVLSVAGELDRADTYPDKIECRIPASRVLGGGDQAGRGFYQLMDGIEVGRVNVAARGCGVAHPAFELGVRYARSRRTFGKIIGERQAISFKLAEMYLAAEYRKEVVEDAFRIHGGYGYSTEYEIERLYRDAPMLLIGEGTSEVQKMIIGQCIVRTY